MPLPELLPALQELSRADKLRAMQFLVTELAREEGVTPASEISLPVWSPFDAFDAANMLLDAIKADEQDLHDQR
jgi:hypothetical protein